MDLFGYGAERLNRHSRIRRRHHGEARGEDMYKIVGQRKITINRDGDVAGDFANNMRAYQAAACGTILATDMKDQPDGVLWYRERRSRISEYRRAYRIARVLCGP